jgi:DNA-binding transcriptional ArsR family regulator
VNSSAQLDRSFLALSHPVRRTIVERLARGSASVGEATRGIAVSKPAVTKHLKVLEEAGVISRRVEGRTHQLSLRARTLADAERWLETHRALWEAKFEAVERHLAKGETDGD